MAVAQSEIERFAGYTAARKNLQEAKSEGKPTAFLSHSHKDAHIAAGVQGFLQSHGWEVYIDWQDAAMPDSPNRETAERIQQRIRRQELFLFLATANSMTSRWCPWEIGYADGVKQAKAILVIPTQDANGRSFGNEYLQLYRHIDLAKVGGIGHFGSDMKGYVLKGVAVP